MFSSCCSSRTTEDAQVSWHRYILVSVFAFVFTIVYLALFWCDRPRCGNKTMNRPYGSSHAHMFLLAQQTQLEHNAALPCPICMAFWLTHSLTSCTKFFFSSMCLLFLPRNANDFVYLVKVLSRILRNCRLLDAHYFFQLIFSSFKNGNCLYNSFEILGKNLVVFKWLLTLFLMRREVSLGRLHACCGPSDVGIYCDLCMFNYKEDDKVELVR